MRIRPVLRREDLAERLADDALRLRDAGPLGIRRVAEEEVDALIADRGELADVGPLAVDGCVVDLVVARVHDAPAGRLEHDRGRVRDRVRHANEFDPERAEIERLVAGRDLAQLRFARKAVLVQLRLDQAEREPRRDDDRNVHLAHEIRQRADVVLVAVREHDAADHLRALDEIGEVREDEVDAEMLVAREREACIDDDDRALGLVGGHVLPHLAEAAEGNDPADAHQSSCVAPSH